jgi:hypothetical protein
MKIKIWEQKKDQETTERRKMRKAFYQLEKEYRPYFDLLVENQDRYIEYKGGVTLDGYLNYEPEILLLGYNPSHGLGREYMYKEAHLVNMGERPFSLFKFGNTRKEAKWWDRSKPQTKGHGYLTNTIELLFSYEEALGKGINCNDKSRPEWACNIEKEIMVLNLYPFGTHKSKDLRSMFRKIVTDPDFVYRDSYTTEWKLRRHFIKIMRDFIFNSVKPKCIICLGKETISDFTYREFEEKKDYYVSEKHKNVIGFSRKGSWEKRAKEVGKKAAEIVKQRKDNI